jgi:hypothetical protein
MQIHRLDNSKLNQGSAAEISPKREWDWIFVAATLLASVLLFQFRGTIPNKGSQVTVSVTVVPRDLHELACASDRLFDGGLACEYESAAKGGGKIGARTMPIERTLAPYVTTAGAVILLTNIFAHESVRLESRERSRGRKSEQRFTVTCAVTILEKLDNAEVRFSRQDNFHVADHTWVGRAESCSIGPTARQGRQ